MAFQAHMFSSSVTGTYDASLITVSSSPEFPSIDDLVGRTANRPPLPTGSRTAPIPETGFKSLIKASTVSQANIVEPGVQDIHSAGQGASNVVGSSGGKGLKAPAAIIVVDESETLVATKVECAVNAPTCPNPNIPKPKPKRVCKPRVKKVADSEALNQAVITEVLPKTKPRRKAKEKDVTAGQTTLAKGKVTKATVAKPKETKKRSESVSKHFTQPAPVQAQTIDMNEPVDLERALARRVDSWTPTKDTAAAVIVLDSSIAKEADALTPISSSLQPRKDLFTTLRDTYACGIQEDHRRPSAYLGEPVDIFGKRKLVEMVNTGQGVSTTLEVSPTKLKAKAVKKKPRTITELATAAYRVTDDSNEVETGDESLLNYFAVDEQSVSGDCEVQKSAGGKPMTRKAGAKAKPKKATKKKVEIPKQILLSPASALRQVSRQDFVFGTSSQLATEEDAGLLRDLQLAMKASNQQREEETLFASSPVGRNEATKLSRRRLWAAGARDEDGELLQVEVIDLVGDVDIPEDLTNPEVIMSLAEPSHTHQAGNVEQSLPASIAPTINSIAASSSIPSQSSAQPTSHFFSTQVNKATTITAPVPKTINSIATIIPSATNVIITDLSDWDDEPPASNQEHFHLIASQAIKSPPQQVKPSAPSLPPTKPAHVSNIVEIEEKEAIIAMPPTAIRKAPVPKMPDFEKRTDEQLAKEIKKYGFKPVKRRGPAIALLTQCWLSKNKTKPEAAGQVPATTASIATTSNTGATSSSAVASPKPRGRPKKVVAAVPIVSDDTVAAVSAEATKKPRGRPKKDAAFADGVKTAAKVTSKRTAKVASLSTPAEIDGSSAARPSAPKRRKKSPPRDIVEIADSDGEDMDPLSPSPSLSPEPANEFSSLPQLDASMTEDDSLTLTPTDDQAASFGYITDAVKTAPRTKDPEKPSWHEKMLMYDPVVLEDLTAWLNGGQLTRVGWDGEVSTADVRKWCESRSVCCVWKVTWNGKDRARF